MATDDRRPTTDTTEATPTAPRLRLVQTSFARLSSGFRVPARTADRDLMAISDALEKRLATRRLRVVPPPEEAPQAASSEVPTLQRAPDPRAPDSPSSDGPSLGSVIARMRRLAVAADGVAPGEAADHDLSSLLVELRREVEAGRIPASVASTLRTSVGQPGAPLHDVSHSGAAAASMMQRLMGAIARARALEGNLAAAASDPDVVSRAEEAVLLSRAQGLLEEGVSRFTQAPTRPRLRPILN
jgi:hypothetical protein